MATIARGVSIVSIENLFLRGLAARRQLALMRWEDKEGKIDVAEGLSQ